MEQKGYFEPGFASVDFTSACNLFFGGTGAIFYTGSGQISLAEEMYDNGELGFFPVPDTEGMDNMSTNVPVHAGFAEGFNKATYDDTMQEFFDYMCENYSDVCYCQADFHHLVMKLFQKDFTAILRCSANVRERRNSMDFLG